MPQINELNTEYGDKNCKEDIDNNDLPKDESSEPLRSSPKNIAFKRAASNNESFFLKQRFSSFNDKVIVPNINDIKA